MRLKNKLKIFRTIYLIIWLLRLPLAIVLLPFDLLLQLFQWFYATSILKVQKIPGSSIEDKKIALQTCGCEVCKQELKRLLVEETYNKTNENRNKCKFCGKLTVVNLKTQKHYCPDCG